MGGIRLGRRTRTSSTALRVFRKTTRAARHARPPKPALPPKLLGAAGFGREAKIPTPGDIRLEKIPTPGETRKIGGVVVGERTTNRAGARRKSSGEIRPIGVGRPVGVGGARPLGAEAIGRPHRTGGPVPGGQSTRPLASLRSREIYPAGRRFRNQLRLRKYSFSGFLHVHAPGTYMRTVWEDTICQRRFFQF